MMTEKQAILLLWYLTNASPNAFWKLYNGFHSALLAVQQSCEQWQKMALHTSHITRFQDYNKQGKPKPYVSCLDAAKRGDFEVLFFTDTHYPKQLNTLTHRPPLLFIKGNKNILNFAQVAMVGTRKPSKSAQDITESFAHTLASEGLWVTSGLAEGIDKYAHIGALKQGMGRTVAVLGSGIDICYPKQNTELYQQIVAQGGVVISELLPNTPPQAHNFPRRNRIVSGLSIATVVMEAALKSGSMITAGFAAEEGKLVFAVPGHIYNKQAQGCHHLIREGAILVDSPQTIIEDINLPRRLHQDNMENDTIHTQITEHILPTSKNSEVSDTLQQAKVLADTKVTPEQNIPEYLESLLNSLDWVGQDMDKIMSTNQLDIATLSSYLMELELQGLVIQTAGLYMRCRP